MSTQLDFYFDFGSPTAYLAYRRLTQLETLYDLEIVYKPMLLGGVFKATGNSTPMVIAAKGNYMSEHDMPRFAKRYGVELVFNPFFPINTLYLMRGVFAAIHLNCLPVYLDAVYTAMWIEQKNMGDLDIVANVLSAAALDAQALLAAAQQPQIKQALIAATEEAVARGAFGAPTMYIGDEMFFGQDRLDFVEERLLPSGFATRPDGSYPLVDNGHVKDSLRGSPGFFLPVPDVPLQKATYSEVSSYQAFVRKYNTEWKRVDPVTVVFSRNDSASKDQQRVSLDIIITPYAQVKYSLLQRHLAAASERR